ncbi:YceG-like family protein [Proteiniborus ethanoligenes]|uniref:YceG-like family protein n=1 Tax=Proteiniborus ethanoligenes TaxID=415015 RepID=A0A1H3PYG1_9FIRM|nr:endolytic transglycosylase MltG [Proteiniborus ethanoligenes]TAH63953.1 MAG: hypothetical protein EWM50_00760 [Gottschalkiaceae bacterium]SDZ05981.1 YceG-like family protein [Proteiniborus ethanoligenes]
MNRNKTNKLFLLLGIGIGFVIASLLNIAYPKIKYTSYTDEQVIEKARELGMVSLKEAISQSQDSVEKNNEDDEEKIIDEKLETIIEEDLNDNDTNAEAVAEENETIKFVISKGQNSEEIINKLFEAGIINDKEVFTNLAIERNVQKKFNYGTFQLNKNMEYDLLIKALTRR